MKQVRQLREMLRIMQGNDPNGDWLEAPLDADTLSAAYHSLDRWSREGTSFEHKRAYSLLEDLEMMWEEVCDKIYDEVPVTDLEFAIFESQAGEYHLSMSRGVVWIILGNREYR